MRTAMIAGYALLLLGCSAAPSGPPEIVVDRTACSHCSMLISEPVYAAAYRAPGGNHRVFDDIGCLLEAARAESGSGLQFWFHDASDGRWIDGTEAVFVGAGSIPSPMGGGLIAYRDRAAAEAAAGKHRGEMIRSLTELLQRTGPAFRSAATEGGPS